MEPINQPVLLIVHDHVLVVKGEDDKIDEPIIKKALPNHHEKYTGQKYHCDPIGGVYESKRWFHYSNLILSPLIPM